MCLNLVLKKKEKRDRQKDNCRERERERVCCEERRNKERFCDKDLEIDRKLIKCGVYRGKNIVIIIIIKNGDYYFLSIEKKELINLRRKKIW